MDTDLSASHIIDPSVKTLLKVKYRIDKTACFLVRSSGRHNKSNGDQRIQVRTYEEKKLKAKNGHRSTISG